MIFGDVPEELQPASGGIAGPLGLPFSESKQDLAQRQEATLSIEWVQANEPETYALTVRPSLQNENSYKFKVYSRKRPVKPGDDLSLWDDWDGASTVQAWPNAKVVIAEVDSQGICVASGAVVVD